MFHTPILFPTQPFAVAIVGVTITGGVATASDGPGGGIQHTNRGSTLNLIESTVRGNRAIQGGGVSNGAGQGFGETLVIRRSTISGNRTIDNGQGGGIQNTENMTIENSTVSGNRSRIGGGIMQQDGTLRITDSTVAFNRSPQVGGIFVNGGSPVLKNTIVSNNGDSEGFIENCSEPVTSEGNNLENGTSCGFTAAGDLNANPRLGPLDHNGGPTKTHALRRGSAAIDAGAAPFPTTDQRGVARPQGEVNDIGAYEKERPR